MVHFYEHCNYYNLFPCMSHYSSNLYILRLIKIRHMAQKDSAFKNELSNTFGSFPLASYKLFLVVK